MFFIILDNVQIIISKQNVEFDYCGEKV